MGDSNLITFLVAGGGAGALVATLRIIFERKKIGADATAVVTRAARELVDPLRQELENERKSNVVEISAERLRVALLRKELDATLQEARALRAELQLVRTEVDQLRRDANTMRRRIADLEQGGDL